MSETEMPEASVIALRARRLKRWLTILIVAVALMLPLEALGSARASGSVGFADMASVFARQLLVAVPAVVYLVALWSIRRALASISIGAPFAPAVAQALGRVGWLLLLGSLLAIFVMPNIYRLLDGGYPRLIEFDITNIVIGGLGISLTLFSKLFESAGAMQRELEDIF